MAQLHQEDLLQTPPNQVAPEMATQPLSCPPAAAQLPATLPVVPLVPLPDPNSIGVPPPSVKLPYPGALSSS